MNLSTSSTDLEQLIRDGSLRVGDNVAFTTHVEVARLFGKNYKAHQQASFKLDDSTEVWFPKMYANDDWSNVLDDTGEVLVMKHVEGGNYGSIMESDPERSYSITFGHIKEAGAPTTYRFLGVFERAPHLSDSTVWVRQRVASVIYFDGAGGFNFEPERSRPELDDQAAEAADSDPKQVAALQQQMEDGSYAIEDQHVTAKTRGSAQQVFARRVKTNYGWQCAVTGISTPAFLVASHIVPWSEDHSIRLDPTNGICLSTFVDRAFDAGFLRITPEGRTAVVWEKVDDALLRLELSRIDDVELSQPSVHPPDPAKLARRHALDL